MNAKLFQKTAILGSYTTNADHKFLTSVTIWAAILVPESAAPPKFFEIIVKTAAPRQIRTFVRSPALLPLISLSSSIVELRKTAKSRLTTSFSKIIILLEPNI